MSDELHKMVETEIKLHIRDLDAIRARLDAAGATLVAPRVHEHNVWYEDEDESLWDQGVILRLRKDTRARLTYKAPPPLDVQTQPGTERVRTRFEAEVTVDDYDTMDVILQRLGFHPFRVYEKYRTTYELNATEIVLDEMPFGTFMEIEGTPDRIDAVLAALDLSDQPRILTNYMSLFEIVKAAVNVDAHDLTFANFKGVHVPPDVFYSGPFLAR